MYLMTTAGQALGTKKGPRGANSGLREQAMTAQIQGCLGQGCLFCRLMSLRGTQEELNQDLLNEPTNDRHKEQRTRG